MTEDAKLPVNQNGEAEMVAVACVECGQTADLGLMRKQRTQSSRDLELRGTITCSGDQHEWPIAIKTDNVIQSTEQAMPVLESATLDTNVPEGLRQDIKEAESAHFARVYKASAVMCRRAVQLGLAETPHEIADGPFTKMIEEAEGREPKLLSPIGFTNLRAVKDYGDIGAHRIEEITAPDARTAIFSAVRVLNELFQ